MIRAEELYLPPLCHSAPCSGGFDPTPCCYEFRPGKQRSWHKGISCGEYSQRGRLESLGCARQHITAKKNSRKQLPLPKCCLRGFSEGVLRWHVALKGCLDCHLGVSSKTCASVSTNGRVQGGARSCGCLICSSKSIHFLL